MEILIKNAQVALENEIIKTNVLVKDGFIEKIADDLEDAQEVFDATGLHLFPGFIDTQVHFRDPGLTHKEDLESGSLSALYGGVTTFFEMPNTAPPTLDAKEIAKKVSIAREKSHVNFGFYLGADGTNIEEVKNAHKMPGCCGIKIFLGSSTGPLLLEDDEGILNTLKSTHLPVAVHSEYEPLLKERFKIVQESKNVADHPLWRNEETALKSTKRIIALARKANKKIHVLHVTTKQEIEFLQENSDICTFEITPQHMTLFAPDCYERIGSLAQMNPPIRTIDHRDALREALKQGLPYVVGSDHAPHTLEEKKRPYPSSPSGMPGVQTIVPLTFNLIKELNMDLLDVKKYLCSNPAKFFSMEKRGEIKEGYIADITLLNLEANHTISSEEMKYKCGWTPFVGLKTHCKVERVLLAGKWALKNGEALESKGKAFNDLSN